MTIIFPLILLFFGIILLIFGARFLVNGASALARRFNISEIAIGLSVVAIGTSLPELVVDNIAGFQGKSGIVFGDILGSNIANILIILGIASLIAPIKIKTPTVWKEIPFSLMAVLAVMFLANDNLFNEGSAELLGRGDGLILLLFFIAFVFYLKKIAKTEKVESSGQSQKLGKIIGSIVAGIVLLAIGGQSTVNGAVGFAEVLGVSQALIASTIVAIGTSLPELTVSAVATLKRQQDIAIGNIIGSNIINIFLVLGMVSLINPQTFSNGFNVHLIFIIIATLVLFASCFINKKYTLERWQGALMLGLYVIFLWYNISLG